MEGFGKLQPTKPLHCILLHLPFLTSPVCVFFAVLTLFWSVSLSGFNLFILQMCFSMQDGF